MIATANIDKEVDEIAKALFKKVAEQSRPKNILINTSYTIPICTVLAIFIVMLFTGKVPTTFQSGSGYYTALFSAIMLFIVILGASAANMVKKDK